MNEILIILVLAGLVVSALLSVMIRSLIKAAVSLALASAFLSLLMYFLGAWIAAVIELSVCAGMITVVFISAISLTKPLTDEEVIIEAKSRMARFIYLPFILAAVLALLIFLRNSNALNFNFIKPLTESVPIPDLASQGSTFWDKRSLDILGQVIVILSGVFGVVVLFKSSGAAKERKAK